MDNFADFFAYAQSYKQAGDALIEWVARKKGQADSIIHPLCFLYRQYLELTLKSVTSDCHRLLGKSVEIKNTHNIRCLWKRCKEILSEIYSNEFLNDNSEIEKRIERFLSISPSHDAFRYPILKNQNLSFSEQHYVNVRILEEEIKEIWAFFFEISNDIAEKLKNMPYYE